MIGQIIGKIQVAGIWGETMSCDDQCQNIIYQSGDTQLNFTLKNCDGSPFVITSASEIAVYFQTVVNPPVILRLSLSQVVITNGGAGQFACVMSQSNAALLQTGLINVEVRVTIAGEITVAEIVGQLTVTPSLFPGY